MCWTSPKDSGKEEPKDVEQGKHQLKKKEEQSPPKGGRRHCFSRKEEYPEGRESTSMIAGHRLLRKISKPNNIDKQFEIIDDTSDSAMQNYQHDGRKKAPDLFYVTVGSVSFVSISQLTVLWQI